MKESEENGLVIVDTGASTEFIVYGQLVPGQVPYRATLVDCQRGCFGTSPAAHFANVRADNRMLHCLIPGGYTAVIDGDGLNNTNPGQATFFWKYGIFEYGTRDGEPTPGTVLCCENEDLRVDSVNGAQMTVTRGFNGTPIAAHGNGRYFSQYSPTLRRASQGVQDGYALGPLRTHPDLQPLMLPLTTQATAPDGIRDFVWIDLHLHSPTLAMARGHRLFWPGGEWGAGMLGFEIPPPTSVPSNHYGFRCCWRPERIQGPFG